MAVLNSELTVDREDIRHRLVCLFAVEKGLLSQAELLEVVSRSGGFDNGGQHSLGSSVVECLTNEGAISLERLETLYKLADEFSLSLSQQSDKLSQLSNLFSKPSELATQSMPLGEVNSSSPKPNIAQAHDPKEHSQRFQIVREYARGGLGVIYLAEDKQLKREVALKQIRADRSGQAVYRHKFNVEAEVTGKLEHPGIVPVYALETDEHGNPYYAMKLIRGETFYAIIQTFHQRERTTTRAYDGAELRELLRRFIDACNAVGYAHDRGILHRDLKPQNIMIGKHGETLVVDWGLAKPIVCGSPATIDAAQVESSFSKMPIRVGSNTPDLETLEGTFVGTLGYAAPEQLLGQTENLSPASDVYSLGVILYELLTGKRPATGSSFLEIAQKTMHGQIAAPFQVNKQIPKGLSSICMKAMAVLAVDRYADCNKLTNDMLAWLDDRPTTALPDRRLDQVFRWIRQHREAAAISTIALVILTLASIGSAILFNMLSAREKSARVQASLEQKSAEAAREAAELSQREAEFAQAQEARAKQEALKNTVAARRSSYLANIRLAATKWSVSDVDGMMQSLNNCVPQAGETDPRDWEWYYLQNLTERDLFRFHHHTADVLAVGFTKDGSSLISAAFDGKIIRKDLATDASQALAENQTPIMAACVSPDGSRLAYIAHDTEIRILDTQSGETMQTLVAVVTPRSARMDGLVIDASNQWLASSSFDLRIRIWSLKTGELLFTSPEAPGEGEIMAMAFAPDAERLAYIHSRGILRIIDMVDPKIKQERDLNDGAEISSLCYSPDGRRLLAGNMRGQIFFLNAETGEPLSYVQAGSHQIRTMTMSPDGKTLATAGRDRIIELWNWTKMAKKLSIKGHTSSISSLHFSPDSASLASGGRDLSVRVWDATGNAINESYPASKATRRIANMDDCISRNSRLIVRLSPDGVQLMKPLPSSQLLWAAGDQQKWQCLAASTLGRFAAIGEGNKVRLFNVELGKEVLAVEGHAAIVTAVTFASDDKSVFTADEKGHVIQTQLDPRAAPRELGSPPELKSVSRLSLDPSGRYLVALGKGRIVIWEIENGRQISDLPFTLTTPLSRANVSSDGKQLAVVVGMNFLGSTTGNQCQIWNTETGQVTHTLHGHTETILDAKYNRQGNRLFTTGVDQTLRIWDPNSGVEILSLPIPKSFARELTISPDDAILSLVDAQGNFMLYDGRHGVQLDERRREMRARNLASRFRDNLGVPLPKIRSAIAADRTYSADVHELASSFFPDRIADFNVRSFFYQPFSRVQVIDRANWQELVVQSAKLDETALKELPDAKWDRVTLVNCQLENASIAYFAACADTLSITKCQFDNTRPSLLELEPPRWKELSIYHATNCPPGLFEKLLRGENLTRLAVPFAERLPPNFFELLKPHKKLEVLDLGSSHLKDVQFEQLGQLSTLRHLQIHANSLSAEQVKQVGGLGELENLNLGENLLGDEIVPALKRLSKLKKLYLYSTNVTSVGLKELLTDLPLEQLDLRNTTISKGDVELLQSQHAALKIEY